jgi:general stress protein 26
METQAQQNPHYSQDSSDQPISKLVEKISDVKIAMLSTLSEDGRLHSRPMYTQEIKEDGLIWFFTGKDSRKSREIERNPLVSLSYSNPDTDLYVSVSGRAILTADPTMVNELWKDSLKAWFPQGKEDPNIQLIRIKVEEAEYWDTPDSRVVQLIGYVKARLTGERFQPGENEKFEF